MGHSAAASRLYDNMHAEGGTVVHERSALSGVVMAGNDYVYRLFPALGFSVVGAFADNLLVRWSLLQAGPSSTEC